MDEYVKWRATPTLPMVRVDDTLEIYAPTIRAVPLSHPNSKSESSGRNDSLGTRTTQRYKNTSQINQLYIRSLIPLILSPIHHQSISIKAPEADPVRGDNPNLPCLLLPYMSD
jgi:hypothetical protein